MSGIEPEPSSRRRLLSLGAATGIAGLFSTGEPMHASPATSVTAQPTHDVRTSGAAGDSASDDTSTFQRALDACGKANGGTVYAPPGQYLLRSTLIVPAGVTLRGSFSNVPSHSGFRNRSQPKPGDDPATVEVRSTNKGVVRISNSAFWGQCDQIAKIGGEGTVVFSDRTFVHCDKEGDRAAIQASSGSLLIRGCEFLENKRHIALHEAVRCAVVPGNAFHGPAQIEKPLKE